MLATSLPYIGSVIARQIFFSPDTISGIIFYLSSSDPYFITGGMARANINPKASLSPGFPIAANSSITINS